MMLGLAAEGLGTLVRFRPDGKISLKPKPHAGHFRGESMAMK
jgi:hypothetical protein